MNYTLTNGTAFPLAEVKLNRGEQIRLERGAMVYHNGLINLEGKMNSEGGGVGGFLKALGRSAVSGESFFVTTATATADGAVIGVAPGTPGVIRELQLGLDQWRLNDGAFLASDTGVNYVMQRQSLGKAAFGGTGGFFVMETQGKGSMLINAYGDILEFQLDGSGSFVVDNAHVVAWTTTLDYSLKVGSGLFGFKTGEGLVNEFHGRGTVLLQTRNVSELASMLAPFLPKKD